MSSLLSTTYNIYVIYIYIIYMPGLGLHFPDREMDIL